MVDKATPRFTLELVDDTVRLRLLATGEGDHSAWHWNGHEWEADEPRLLGADKPRILDDPRLDGAVQWLRRLDWFTPEPGLWVGDANENFLAVLSAAWPDRPKDAEFLGNPAFHRLFLAPRPLRARVIVTAAGSIGWPSRPSGRRRE